MKRLFLLNSCARCNFIPAAGLVMLFLHAPCFLQAQCASAPIAAAACSGGSGAVANNTTIGTGLTYWYGGAATTMTGINLNGGILRVCGTLTLSGPNFGSGDLIVESGGNLTITSMPTMGGGITIINRGTLTISGSFTMQNNNNYIYNDLTTSVLNITNSGVVTMNGTSSYIINRGIINMTSAGSGIYYQAGAGGICLQDQSQLTMNTFNNVTTNSITYSGTGSPACVNITKSAVLQDNVTTSSNVHVCLGGTETTTGGATSNAGGGWGSAVVTSNCSSCAVVLALTIDDLTATQQAGSIKLQWSTNDNPADHETFHVEKSVDGINFYTLTSVEASAGQKTYTAYDAQISNPKLYYRIGAVSPSGAGFYSAIVVVETGIVNEKFQVYPNPVSPDRAITLVINSAATETADLSLVNMAGQIINRISSALFKGGNQLSWNFRGVAAGIYIVKITSASNGSFYSRIVVTNGY